MLSLRTAEVRRREMMKTLPNSLKIGLLMLLCYVYDIILDV